LLSLSWAKLTDTTITDIIRAQIKAETNFIIFSFFPFLNLQNNLPYFCNYMYKNHNVKQF